MESLQKMIKEAVHAILVSRLQRIFEMIVRKQMRRRIQLNDTGIGNNGILPV